MELFGVAERITSEVLGWENVNLGEHRSGAIEFRIDRQAFGYLHGNSMVDILLPKTLRVQLVTAGIAEPHPANPGSGWITIYLNRSRKPRQAIKTLRVAYEILRDRKRLRASPFPSKPKT